MMIQMRTVGKALLVGVILTLLGGAALSTPVNEQAWIELERGQQAEALELCQNQTDVLSRWIVAVVEVRTGLVASDEGPISEAARFFENRNFSAAAAILEQPPTEDLNPDDQLHLNLRLAGCLVELGSIPEAETLLTTAIEQARHQQRIASECYGLLTRGRARVRLRQVDPPRQDLLAAWELAKKMEAQRWAGVAAIALSVVSRLQMDLDDALQWRETAYEHYLLAEDLSGQARALHYIAAIGIMKGELTRAMTQLQDADAVARRAADEAALGGILGEMAAINYLLGDFDQALDQYHEAVRLAPNPWRRGMMLVNIGSIYEYRRQPEKAIPVLEEALELMRQVGDHRTATQALLSLGEAHNELEQYDKGLATLDEAIDSAREFEIPMSEAYAQEIKGQALLARGDLAAAVAAFDAATELARQIGYFDILEWSLLGRAQVARRQGQNTEALEYLQEALKEVAAVRRGSGGAAAVTGGIVNEAGGIYSEMIDLLFEMHQGSPGSGYDLQAWDVAQEKRSRAFQDLMAEAEYDLQISAVPGYKNQESEILERIIELEKKLATAEPDSAGPVKADLAGAEDELQLLEARLRAEDPRYAEVLYRQPVQGAVFRQEVLNPGEVLLEYSLGEEASYLWVMSRQKVDMIKLSGRQEVDRQVRQLLPLLWDYNLSGPEAAWYVEPARALYRLLVEPAAGQIAQAEHLVVCADGILHYLPFEALLTADTGERKFAHLPWLVKEKSVSYTPSATVLERLRRAEKSRSDRGDWLLVGDPLLVKGEDASLFARAAGAVELPPLPYAAEELSSLAAVAGEKNTARILSGPEATVANLAAAGKGGNLSLVHFASHGLFNESRPRYSGLVVSPDPQQGDDGFLSVSEVLALDLECDQVVLSACASALGPQVSGDGLVGLTRSFLFAGSRSVVSALWDVSGRETARFMEKYYGQLAAGTLDRSESLARAKRSMIGETQADGPDPAHPAFWAAFVLSGAVR